jgi:hypothetical protein
MAGWDTGNPIHDRLPGENEGYRKDESWDGHDPSVDPPIARWLTEPWDALLMESKGKIETIYTTHLNPLTAEPENLDWLAQLHGFTGEYWSVDWDVAVKRQLIANSFTKIWENKGSRSLLEWIFQTFGLETRIYLYGEFLADINVAGDVLGGEALQYWLLVTLKYLRTSDEWKLLEKLNRLYSPVCCNSRVTYDQFYADFSIAGDPVWT